MKFSKEQIQEAFNGWYMAGEAMMLINNYEKKRNEKKRKILQKQS